MTEEQKEFYWNEWKREEDQYETTDFYIFLLVLHQRYALLNFSKELSEIGVKSKEKKIARLRDILYEFMIQGWFSQITDDEDGLKKYKKWSNVFETETLYEEVIQQVSTIADYENAKKEKDFNFRFTVISFIFLIITGISGFFGMNLPIIKQFSNEGAVIFSIISTIGILILWYGIFLFGRLKK